LHSTEPISRLHLVLMSWHLSQAARVGALSRSIMKGSRSQRSTKSTGVSNKTRLELYSVVLRLPAEGVTESLELSGAEHQWDEEKSFGDVKAKRAEKEPISTSPSSTPTHRSAKEYQALASYKPVASRPW
jgi:hypothetical protein